MTTLLVQTSVLNGSIIAPPSKSHSQRAILFASFATGTSQLIGILPSPDIEAMINACRQFGAHIKQVDNCLWIQGVGGRPMVPDDVIDAGNSGQVLRFVGAMAGLLNTYTVITGDHSIRHQRPVKPLLSGLQQLGCDAISTRLDDFAPIVVRGPIQGGEICIQGQDSQPVSALLMACAFAKHKTHIKVTEPGETPWVGLTLDWLKRLQIPFSASDDFTDYHLSGNAQVLGFHYQVPGDFSSIAFPLVAAAITGGSISIRGLDKDDAQGDKAIVDLLRSLGFLLTYTNDGTLLLAKHDLPDYPGFTLNINTMVDALPILAVLACFAQSPSRIYGAEIVKSKESNRIEAIASELRLMGASIQTLSDGLFIEPSALKGALVDSHHDHRIAMALAVAGLRATGQTCIQGVDCIAKSYPQFVAHFEQLGANIVKG